MESGSCLCLQPHHTWPHGPLFSCFKPTKFFFSLEPFNMLLLLLENFFPPLFILFFSFSSFSFGLNSHFLPPFSTPFANLNCIPVTMTIITSKLPISSDYTKLHEVSPVTPYIYLYMCMYIYTYTLTYVCCEGP